MLLFIITAKVIFCKWEAVYLNKKFHRLLSLLCVLLVLAAVVVPASAESAPAIYSAYYQVDGTMIRGIAPGTTGEKLCKVCAPAGLTAPEGLLATGDQLTDGEQSLTVIVTADLNCDGKVTITDLLMLKTCLLGTELAPDANAAADVNYDGKVTITDFLKIKAKLLELEQILPGRTAPSEEALLLLQPGGSVRWTAPDAVAYRSDDEALLSADETGSILAKEAEGTAFVYALDGEGREVSRVLVTVLEEPLAVSLDQAQMHLIMGSTAKLTPRLNHPVDAGITWSTSDETVAAVSQDGTVTAVKPGNAVVAAQLSNGSRAELSITVAPPITKVETERALYKVKPGNTKQIALEVQPAGEGEVFTWTSSDPSVATVNDYGVVTGVKYGTVKITVTGKYSGLSASCDVKVCDVKQIAITFDDGPSLQTPKLLDFLKKNDIRVTFFLVGNRLSSNQNTVKREAAEGHELGYHSYAHVEQTTISTAQIQSDFQKTNDYLKELTGREFTVWRAPGGGISERVLKAIELPHIMWSIDTLDWKYRDADRVCNYILRHAKDGSIVLMHDLYGTTVTGAIRAMEILQEGDFEFVTVTELLSRNGTPPQPGVSYAQG